jgi:hypothetical protein
LWLTDELQSTKDRRAHYALMKWEMKHVNTKWKAQKQKEAPEFTAGQ